MDLVVHPETLAVCRLPGDVDWPGPSDRSSFTSVTRTPDEISVVCPTADVPPGAEVEHGWRLLSVAGPLEFTMIGVLASLASTLADAGISVFVVSTFTTDHVLVGSDALGPAVEALRRAGHSVAVP